MSENVDLELVREAALQVRAFLDEQWQASGATSLDQCRRATAFLKEILTERFPDIEWVCVGGSPVEDADIDQDVGMPGGYRGSDEQWHGHYWLISDGYGMLVDITADQFGDAPVVVDADDDRYRDNYHPQAVEDHMRDVAFSVRTWMELWRAAGSSPKL